MLSKFSGWEILLILVIILIVLGAGKLPQMSNAIGKGLNVFKRWKSGEVLVEEEEDNNEVKKV